jgi:hypothetical protein
MASKTELLNLGFAPCAVTARRLNIVHEDPRGLGPFCRLAISGQLSDGPGVYAWVVDDTVMYVGKAGRLRAVIQGTKIGRAYNDYTYVPPSKVRQTSSPRVRVNGLLNKAIVCGSTVSWWWFETPSEAEAASLEMHLISTWSPAWNRAGRPID